MIPKSLLGTSLWLEILLDKYASHRPTERLLSAWKHLGLDIAASTVADGLQRLRPLYEPLYQAIPERVRQSAAQQADETRWLVFVDKPGKEGYRWWLWVFLGSDAVVYVLDPRRSHDVPEGHFRTGVSVVLMVDRLSSYKATAPVKDGLVVLAFCWAHVRRDFIAVAKSFPELKRVRPGRNRCCASAATIRPKSVLLAMLATQVRSRFPGAHGSAARSDTAAGASAAADPAAAEESAAAIGSVVGPNASPTCPAI